MNDGQLDHLFAFARNERVDTSRAEFGFETRILARLRSERISSDMTSIWAAVSWRLMPLFLTCMLGVAICSWRVEEHLDEVAAYTSIDHPEAAEVWNSLN